MQCCSSVQMEPRKDRFSCTESPFPTTAAPVSITKAAHGHHVSSQAAGNEVSSLLSHADGTAGLAPCTCQGEAVSITVDSRTRAALLPCLSLTLCWVKHLHGVNKVGSGVEVVWPWLLQPPQAEEDAVSHGTGGEGAAAGHAGVAHPALCLQVKSLKGGDGQLALPAPCVWMR